MAAIDVGSSCDITGSVATAGKTRIDKQNSANLTGTIDYCCLNSDTALTGIKIASFINEGGNVLSTHDYTGLADQGSSGLSEYNAPEDFTAFDIDAGEYLGIYYSSGGIRFNNSGVGQWNSSGDHIPSSSVTYSLTSNVQLSLYATGNTTGEEIIIKIINETLQIVEGIKKLSWIKKVVDEMLQISETTGRLTGITKIINETLQIVESLAKITGITKVVNEVLQLNELILQKTKIIKIINEVLQFSEKIFKKGFTKKIINETLQLSENYQFRDNKPVRIRTNLTIQILSSLKTFSFKNTTREILK